MIDLDVLRRTPFYRARLGDGSTLPFTTKAELVADQAAHPPYGSNLSRPLSEYTRLNQTSGTTSGRPLYWLDTPESWLWLIGRWDIIFRHAGIQSSDRFFFAFSFGPFLGFWTAFEAAQRAGHFCVPGGGMSSLARLRQVIDHQITVVLCTPTYALHLSEVAAQNSIDLSASPVRAIIVAGEPGGLIPATRQRIEADWGARVFDHYGMTEIGPVAVETASEPGGMLIVDGYEAQVIDPSTLQAAPVGHVGELVLGNLGRVDSPLFRYRTGDLVRGVPTPRGLRLEGGILGRSDDMIQIRGNNVYPSAIENIIRRFAEVAEFRVQVDTSQPMAELTITVEPTTNSDPGILVNQIAQVVRDELAFRPNVAIAEPGTLPRFEMKARRFIKSTRS